MCWPATDIGDVKSRNSEMVFIWMELSDGSNRRERTPKRIEASDERSEMISDTEWENSGDKIYLLPARWCAESKRVTGLGERVFAWVRLLKITSINIESHFLKIKKSYDFFWFEKCCCQVFLMVFLCFWWDDFCLCLFFRGEGDRGDRGDRGDKGIEV